MEEQMTFEELQKIVSLLIDEVMELKNKNEAFRLQIQDGFRYRATRKIFEGF